MEKEKRTLKFSEIFGFGAGGMFTYGFQLMITGYYLLYYMTDIAGFSTVLAASLYSTIQIIKMVTMLFSGVIIDAINFRSGKYRTWVLVSGIGLGLFFPLSFFYYPLPQSVYVVVFMIIYTLQTLFYNVGWTAMRAVIGKVAKNKADLRSVRRHHFQHSLRLHRLPHSGHRSVGRHQAGLRLRFRDLRSDHHSGCHLYVLRLRQV